MFSDSHDSLRQHVHQFLLRYLWIGSLPATASECITERFLISH